MRALRQRCAWWCKQAFLRNYRLLIALALLLLFFWLRPWLEVDKLDHFWNFALYLALVGVSFAVLALLGAGVVDRNPFFLLTLLLIGYLLFFVPQINSVWSELPLAALVQRGDWGEERLIAIGFIFLVAYLLVFYVRAWGAVLPDGFLTLWAPVPPCPTPPPPAWWGKLGAGVSAVGRALSWFLWSGPRVWQNVGGGLNGVLRACLRALTFVFLFPLWFLLVFLPGFWLWPRAGAALAGFAERQTVRQRWAWSGLFFAVTVLSFGVRAWHGSLPESHRLYPLAGAACVLFGWLLLATSAWLAATACWEKLPAWARAIFCAPGPGPAPALPAPAALAAPPPLDPVLALCGRACGVMLAATALCEIIWLAADWVPGYVSYRLYTIWAVFHICFFLSVTASVVDVLHNQWRRPYRQAGVVAVVLLVAYVLYPSPVATTAPLGQQENDPLGTPAAAAPDWYYHFEARLNATDPRAPVVFVAASGGGSRAALFTVLVLEALAREPLTDSAGAQLYRQVTGADGRAREDRSSPLYWSDQIVLISGVSGGSLGSAYYVRNRALARNSDIPSLRNSFTREAQLAFERELRPDGGSNLSNIYKQVWKWQPPGGHPAPGGCRAPADGAPQAEDVEKHALRVKEVFNPKRVFNDEFAWVVRNDPADAMCTDFMAPLLRGFMTPRIERGTALSHFWEQRFNWTGCNTLDGYGPDGYGSNRPLLLFNATAAREGSRFVVGFPPLPRGALHHPPRLDDHDPLSSQAGGALEASQTLADFWPRYRVSLAEAVRMSANFPWGLRTARLSKEVYDLRPDVRRRFATDEAYWDEAKRLLKEEVARDEAERRLLLGGVPDGPFRENLADLFAGPRPDWLQGIDRAESREIAAENLAKMVAWLHELSADDHVRHDLRVWAKTVLTKLEDKGYIARRPQHKDLLDGGVNDNTGVPTLWEVLQHLRDLSERRDPLADGRARAKAGPLLTQLRRRGVVLVEIDSGAKPSLQPVAEVQAPVQGLNNAAYATAIAAKSWYYQRLNELLRPDNLPPPPVLRAGAFALPPGKGDRPQESPSHTVLRYTPLYVKVFECNHSTERDVMTAWALAPSDKARVTATFWCEYQQWRELQRDSYRCWLAAWDYFKDLRKDEPLDLEQVRRRQRDDNQRALQKHRLMERMLKGQWD
jgi:hypothetical protein